MTSTITQGTEGRSTLLDLLAPLFFMLMVVLDPLPVGHVYSNALFAVVFVVYVFETLRGNATAGFGPIPLLFMLTIIGHLAPILLGAAVNLEAATSGVFQASLLLFFLYMLTGFFRNRRDRILRALFAITVGFMPIYVIGHLFLNRELAGRATALYQNPNAAGITSFIVLFAVRVLWGLWHEKRGSWVFRLWLMLVSGSALHLALATQSRKSVLMIAVLVLVDLFLYYKRSRSRVIAVVLLAGLLAASGILVMYAPEHSVLDRFRTSWRTFTDPTVTASEEDTGVLTRFELLEVGLELIGEHPVMGQGVGAFRILVSQRSNQVNYEQHSHNTFIDMYVEGGLIAFAAYSLIFTLLISMAWKRRHEDGVFLLILAFILISAGLELGSWRYMDKLKWLVFSIIYCLHTVGSVRGSNLQDRLSS